MYLSYTVCMTKFKATKFLKSYINAQRNKSTFAERLGVSRQYLRIIEKGGPIKSELAIKLLDVTGFSLDEAFESK